MKGKHKDLAIAIASMDDEKALLLAEKIAGDTYDTEGMKDAVVYGIGGGMELAGELYEKGEYFIPEILVCSDLAKAAEQILKTALEKMSIPVRKKGKVVIGSVEGDSHDIGKNIVLCLLEGAGYEMIDLGKDVSNSVFAARALEEAADIVAISTLMTTTMNNVKEVISILRSTEQGRRIKIMVGGKPVTKKFAEEIGADGYSSNGAEAVRLADRLIVSRSPAASKSPIADR